jgi:calcineurin-like phosphoesterase family protein
MTIFLTSDTHFDHTNIISYCNRPFPNTDIMNSVIIELWNKNVNNDDKIYHLGDWTYCGNKPVAYWMKQLNGYKILIHGSHDRTLPQPNLHSCILKSDKHTFKLVHKPEDRGEWRGWIIHGHHHNNYPDIYPFINGINKTINISVELTDYTPIKLDYLESLDIDTIKYMETIHSPIQRF